MTRAAEKPATGRQTEASARRLWLPWRPRFRIIMSYPRHWRWTVQWFDRFDLWFSHKIEGKPFRRLMTGIVFVPWYLLRWLAMVVVIEITIIGLGISLELVYVEWVLLIVLFPFVLLARLAHLLPYRLIAHKDHRAWTTRVKGLQPATQAVTVARDALASGHEPPATTWTEIPTRSRFWM